MKRLNIFVDETGEFGFGKGSSRLYGVSFTFHEQNNDISLELEKLNNRLIKLGYTGMIHMADLIMRRGDYVRFGINLRKSIFNAIYQFSRRISIRYQTIIVDKKYTDDGKVLKQQLLNRLEEMIERHEKYFKSFDKIVMYYDNGQEILGKILDSVFMKFDGFEHRVDFNHEEKRLFQISDMLTCIDKCVYKHKNRINFNKGELYFFTNEDMRRMLKELDEKRL